MLQAISVTDERGFGLEIVGLYEKAGRRFVRRRGYIIDPEVLEVIRPSTAAALEEEPVPGAMDDSVPDLEMTDGDPGDRILPVEKVMHSDPFEAEGIDAIDAGDVVIPIPLTAFKEPDREVIARALDDVWVLYMIAAARTESNPYGSNSLWAGLPDPDMGDAALERHPYTWDDSVLASPALFFRVVEVFPRRLKGDTTTFVGRDGRIHTVPRKEPLMVVVRGGELDETGAFVPGVPDPETGERREVLRVVNSRGLYSLTTGERFPQIEPVNHRPVVMPHPGEWFWKRGYISPKGVGISGLKVEPGDGEALVRYTAASGEERVFGCDVVDGVPVLRPATVAFLKDHPASRPLVACLMQKVDRYIAARRVIGE